MCLVDCGDISTDLAEQAINSLTLVLLPNEESAVFCEERVAVTVGQVSELWPQDRSVTTTLGLPSSRTGSEIFKISWYQIQVRSCPDVYKLFGSVRVKCGSVWGSWGMRQVFIKPSQLWLNAAVPLSQLHRYHSCLFFHLYWTKYFT